MSGVILLVLRGLMAAALYGFLGWTLWLLWKDLRRQARSLSAQVIPPLTLVQEDAAAPVVFHLTAPEAILGRDPTCDLHIDNPNISARHARLTYRLGQWWVDDLGSRNGSWLNDETVSTALVLSPGDVLRCGDLVFKVEIE